LRWKRGVSSQTQPQPAYKDGRPIGGTGRANKLLPNTTDWLGRFRLADNESNDWGMNRAAQQRNEIYSGIDGVHLQDQAITESMGPVTDHAWEHLAPSDQMITRTRRRLLMAARALREHNLLPPGVENPEVFHSGRSGYFVSDDKGSWQEVYAKQLSAAVHPSPVPLPAAGWVASPTSPPVKDGPLTRMEGRPLHCHTSVNVLGETLARSPQGEVRRWIPATTRPYRSSLAPTSATASKRSSSSSWTIGCSTSSSRRSRPMADMRSW